MAIEYFCCYHSYRKKLANLSDQEVGRLFRALLEYSETGETQELTGRESVAFDFIVCDIDNSQENYNAKCRQNSKNAKSGRKQAHTDASETNQNKTKTKDKIETKDISPHTPQGESESFLRFWEAYPRKMDRARAWSAWEQLCPDEGLTAVIMTAVQEQSQSAQWRQEAGRYIPSPEKWLKNCRWEDKLEPAKPDMQRSYDIQELVKMSQFRVPEKM